VPASIVLNLVAEAETDLFPLQLLQRTSKIETQLGAAPGAKGRATSTSTSYCTGMRCDDGGARASASAFSRPPLRAGALADLAPELPTRHRKTVRALLEELRGKRCASV